MSTAIPALSDPEVVTVAGLSKWFGAHQVLSDVDLNVRAGVLQRKDRRLPGARGKGEDEEEGDRQPELHPPKRISKR